LSPYGNTVINNWQLGQDYPYAGNVWNIIFSEDNVYIKHDEKAN
jgi:hypothetical protein